MAQIDILRNKLIDRLHSIKDENVLKAVDTILSETENNKVYKLSEQQILELKESERQIKNGQTKPHDEVMQKARQWLRKK